MKNEKLFKVLGVVIKIAGIVSTVAQVIADAFSRNSSSAFTSPASSAFMSQEDAHIVKDFMNEGLK